MPNDDDLTDSEGNHLAEHMAAMSTGEKPVDPEETRRERAAEDAEVLKELKDARAEADADDAAAKGKSTPKPN